MKKILAMILAAMMLLTVTACGKKGEEKNDDNAVKMTAVEVLNKIFAGYAEEEKFPVGGGDANNMNMEGAGKYDVTLAEDMDATMGLPAAEASKVEDAASALHMMNANNFTGACYTLKEGTDASALADAILNNLKNRQWICGQPDTLLIVTVNGNQMITAFGTTEIINTFKNNLGKAFESYTIVSESALQE